MKILVTSDHLFLRQGLMSLLAPAFPQATYVEAASGQDAIESVRAQSSDLIFLDLHLPDKHGIEVIKEIRNLKDIVPIIVLSQSPEEHYGIRALKAGAMGYLKKSATEGELVACVRKVISGGCYISSSLAEMLAGQLREPQSDNRLGSLTDRELEVLRLFSIGKRNVDIANHLSLSEKTVSTHRGNILRKLQVDSTAALIRYGCLHQLSE